MGGTGPVVGAESVEISSFLTGTESMVGAGPVVGAEPVEGAGLVIISEMVNGGLMNVNSVVGLLRNFGG